MKLIVKEIMSPMFLWEEEEEEEEDNT